MSCQKTKILTTNHLTFRILSGFAVLLVLTSSCLTYTTGASREDFPNRFSKTPFKASSNWKFGEDVIVFKSNNTFRYRSSTMGIQSEFYTGRYERKDSIIVLSFYKNRFPISFEQQCHSLTVSLNKASRPAMLGKTDTLKFGQRQFCGGTIDVLNYGRGRYFVIDYPKAIKNNFGDRVRLVLRIFARFSILQ